MSRKLISMLSIILFGFSVAGAEPKVKKADSKGLELFKTQIEPVLVKHCYECHSKKGKSVEGGLELDSPSAMMRGGDTGPMVKPHDLERSSLIQMLRHEGDVSGMPPEVKLTGWPRDKMIDRFILSAIEKHGIKPVRDANRLTLVRRVYFDLVGLPPSLQEVTAFLTDKSPDALAKLVDQLLASPRFGERWGRHWLDVVRFAECGFPMPFHIYLNRLITSAC